MLLLILAMLAATPSIASQIHAPITHCEYDRHVFELGFEAFDQDLKGGWRSLAEQQGCEGKAANIVRDYRQKYLSIMHLLYWHEAQIRASIGDDKEAISLMEQSHQAEAEDRSGWNPYVDATIAFLRKDRSAFLEAKGRLARFQKPSDWPSDAEWPQNMDVIAGLWNCFGKSYKAAYDASCRAEGKRPS